MRPEADAQPYDFLSPPPPPLMNPDAQALFQALVDRPPADREDYYVRHHVLPDLRAEVESLLLFDAPPGSR